MQYNKKGKAAGIIIKALPSRLNDLLIEYMAARKAAGEKYMTKPDIITMWLTSTTPIMEEIINQLIVIKKAKNEKNNESTADQKK